MEKKKITSRREAQEAFEYSFATLACALNPCIIFYDGLQFVRQRIQLKGGEPFLAYIAHDNAMKHTFIVPVDPEKNGEPTIEDFADVHVIKSVKSAEEAIKAFLAEFGSLSQALNPESETFEGYLFRQETIELKGNIFKAFIATSEDQKTIFVVPVDGTVPSIQNAEDVKLVIRKK